MDDFDTIYVPLSPAFSYPSNFMVIVNDTNYTLLMSFDGGVSSHLAILPNSTFNLDFSANKNANGDALFRAQQGVPLQVRTISIPNVPSGTGIAVTSFYANPSVY